MMEFNIDLVDMAARHTRRVMSQNVCSFWDMTPTYQAETHVDWVICV